MSTWVPSGLRKRSLSPHASSGLQHRVQRSGPLNPSGGNTGQGAPPEPPWARPPKPGGLGWHGSLGKTAHFAGTEALPSVIPHGGTKLGTLPQRWGMGQGGRTNHAHAHRQQGDLKEFSAYSFWKIVGVED